VDRPGASAKRQAFFFRHQSSQFGEDSREDVIYPFCAMLVFVSRKKRPVKTVSVEINPLKGKRKGAVLKEEVWFEDGRVIAYNLAYINLKRCHVDHGRVLGFDNSHGYHHRHFMGRVEAVNFTTYAALSRRFMNEVHALWRIEDEQD